MAARPSDERCQQDVLKTKDTHLTLRFCKRCKVVSCIEPGNSGDTKTKRQRYPTSPINEINQQSVMLSHGACCCMQTSHFSTYQHPLRDLGGSLFLESSGLGVCEAVPSRDANCDSSRGAMVGSLPALRLEDPPRLLDMTRPLLATVKARKNW
jgi:hypothetical protein